MIEYETEDTGPHNVETFGTIDSVLDERGKRYGEFASHAAISQALKDVMYSKSSNPWDTYSPSQREALSMIAHKLARILNGDSNYADSWIDIAGYATLVAKELEQK